MTSCKYDAAQKGLVSTHNQSIFANFSRNEPAGVRTRRKNTTRNKDMPDIGRLRSGMVSVRER